MSEGARSNGASGDELEASLRDAVACADVPALLPAVAQLTGDLTLLREDLRPDPDQAMDPNAGLSPEQVEQARELAYEALRGHLAQGDEAGATRRRAAAGAVDLRGG
jgi:4-hydroxyacetophenone monooxygenase